MSTVLHCDRCHLPMDYNDRVRIEYIKKNKRIYKDFHIDCFNYEFSTDIRKIEGE